jgi:hypothetical protein
MTPPDSAHSPLETSRRPPPGLAWFDWGFGIGLALIVGGVGWWSVPAACVLAGGVVCGVSFRGAVMEKRRAATAAAVVDHHTTTH